MIRLLVSKDTMVSGSWWYSIIEINGQKYNIGRESVAKEDCTNECERIVKNFSKEGIQVAHAEIY